MAITIQPVAIETGSRDREGILLFADGSLVAVLVRLDDEGHDPAQIGSWFVEAAFGPCATGVGQLFADLEEAQAWAWGLAIVRKRPAPGSR